MLFPPRCFGRILIQMKPQCELCPAAHFRKWEELHPPAATRQPECVSTHCCPLYADPTQGLINIRANAAGALLRSHARPLRSLSEELRLRGPRGPADTAQNPLLLSRWWIRTVFGLLTIHFTVYIRSECLSRESARFILV